MQDLKAKTFPVQSIRAHFFGDVCGLLGIFPNICPGMYLCAVWPLHTDYNLNDAFGVVQCSSASGRGSRAGTRSFSP